MSYLAYAGIGSRETPAVTLEVMHHIGAYLCSQGWTLRSGAAPGADTAFEKGVDDHMANTMTNGTGQFIRRKEIYLPWKGFNGSTSDLHPANVPFTDEQIYVARTTHPAWHRCSPSAQRMHTRNVSQILGSEFVNGPKVVPVKFVVCWTEGGKLKGGTAMAIRIAQACQIAVINLGEAKTAKELEALVLQVDSLQATFKG
ncbi:hypothetical protein X766_16045 [Mesorhizobium sp. LSJC255A00]|uniref:hypothetical protein n=1 Tax=Mesorhizobium sp. LSJC255A00 TaxID=1287313 RepID=UPI0003CE8EBD|nr:hypothetical protein [Mesorhizobium sp. LSJC255A00]ESX17541.1 hypothetical protein X766_16045 [Mesorhizobium sp. LSJC255A00]